MKSSRTAAIKCSQTLRALCVRNSTRTPIVNAVTDVAVTDAAVDDVVAVITKPSSKKRVRTAKPAKPVGKKRARTAKATVSQVDPTTVTPVTDTVSQVDPTTVTHVTDSPVSQVDPTTVTIDSPVSQVDPTIDTPLTATATATVVAAVSDYESVIDSLSFRIEVLEEKMAQVVNQMANLRNHDTQFNDMYSGFRSLKKNMQSQYLGGLSEYMVVRPRLKKETTWASVFMCSRYKAIDIEFSCKSRKERMLYDKDESFLVSDKAEYLDVSLMDDPVFRSTNSRDISKIAKRFMVCKECRDHSLENFMLYSRSSEVCMICCAARKSTAVNQIGVPRACSKCTKAIIHNNSAEECLGVFVKLLKNVFKKQQIRVSTNYSPKGLQRKIDMLISGCNFYIIIEKDENQHKGYSVNDDNVKMCQQVNALLSYNPHAKFFVIRYNPNTSYRDITSEVTYNSIERLVILRRWLTWYILNAKEVRTHMGMYLWYDYTIKEKSMDPDYNGLFYINHAPKNETTDWEWCPAPTEIFENVDMNAIEIPSERLWKKEFEGRNNRYMRGIVR